MLAVLLTHSRMDENSEAIASYQRDGFVSVSAFFNSEELATIESELARFKRERIPTLESSEVFYEDIEHPESLKQIQRMQQHDPYFFGLMAGKPQRLAERLLGENVVPKNLQYFNKPPLLGRATPPHQDGYYLSLIHI